jgi:prepilin-type processing-associated H-X9-DG protein
LLFPYTRSSAIYHCPADRSPVLDNYGNPLNPFQPRLRSYGLMGQLNVDWGSPPPPDPPWHICKKTSGWTRPAPTDVLTFIDVHEDVIDEGAFGLLDPTDWGHFPATRHGGGFNLAFVDGHVAHHRLKYAGPRSFGDARGAHGAGDAQDFDWITNRFFLH